jgi:hypothetical protein
MIPLEYRHTERTAEMHLDNGTTIHAFDISRRRDGGLSAVVQINSPEGPLGGGHLSLGDAHKRHDLASSLAGTNGLNPNDWESHLTAFYLGLERALAEINGRLILEDPGVLDVSALPEPGPRRETVQSIMPARKITSFFADGGTGKSFLSNLLAQSVVLGTNFLGEFPTVRGDVLYLDFEDDAEEFTRRSFEIARGLNLDTPPVGLFYRRANQPLADIFYDVMDYVTQAEISITIVDSFGAACAGESEGSRDSIALMQLLQRLPCTVLLIDHEPKARDGRGPSQFGSVYKRNLSRSQVRLEDRGWPEPGRHALVLKHTKLNSGPLHGGFPLYLNFETDRVYAIKADPDDEPFREDHGPEQQVLDALGEAGEATASELAGYTGGKAHSLKNVLTKMVRSKSVEVLAKRGREYVYGLPGGRA